MTGFAVLAAALVAGHLAFVGFAALGSFLALRWPRVAWLHVPCALWAIYVEVTGGICPLTPLENELRRRAGLDPYGGDFVAQYLFPVLYPEGLTRDAQLLLGIAVGLVNVSVYGWILVRRRRRSRSRSQPPRVS